MAHLTKREWFDEDGSGDVDPLTITFGYNTAGDRTLLTRNTGRGAAMQFVGQTTYDYDASGRTTSIIHSGPTGNVLVDYEYIYNAAGLLKTESHHGYKADYTYDKLGQLTDVDYTALVAGSFTPPDEWYRYDANGNRTSSHLAAHYERGPNNRIASDGITVYTFDAEGNVSETSDNVGITTSYSFDFRNRLVQIRLTSGIDSEIERFAYDPRNRRSSVSSQAGHLAVINNGTDVWYDVSDSGAVLAFYAFGSEIDELLSVDQQDTEQVFLLPNVVGTIMDSTSDLGVVSNVGDYSSFGMHLTTVASPSDIRFGFTAREVAHSSLDLYYFRARYYLTSIGRFISKDPAGFLFDTNPYRYLINEPVLRTDPTGLGPLAEYLPLIPEVLPLQCRCDPYFEFKEALDKLSEQRRKLDGTYRTALDRLIELAGRSGNHIRGEGSVLFPDVFGYGQAVPLHIELEQIEYTLKTINDLDASIKLMLQKLNEAILQCGIR